MSYLLAVLLFLVFATNKVFAKEDGLTYCMGEAVEYSEVGGLVDVARARNGLSAPWSQWIAQTMDARGIVPVELSDKGCDIMILSAQISADALAERESGTKNLARIVFDSDLETNTEASAIIAENLERVLPTASVSDTVDTASGGTDATGASALLLPPREFSFEGADVLFVTLMPIILIGVVAGGGAWGLNKRFRRRRRA
jgi:hypothetical protein